MPFVFCRLIVRRWVLIRPFRENKAFISSLKKEFGKFEQKKIEKRTLLKGVTFANLDDQL